MPIKVLKTFSNDWAKLKYLAMTTDISIKNNDIFALPIQTFNWKFWKEINFFFVLQINIYKLKTGRKIA